MDICRVLSGVSVWGRYRDDPGCFVYSFPPVFPKGVSRQNLENKSQFWFRGHTVTCKGLFKTKKPAPETKICTLDFLEELLHILIKISEDP